MMRPRSWSDRRGVKVKRKEKKRKENNVFNQLSRVSYLVRVGKRGTIIHISWYINPLPAEIQLNNNN